jgi:hypothetical protein
LPLTGTTVDDAARRAEPAATEGTTVGRVRRALGHDRRRPTTGGGRRRIPGTTGGGRRRIPGTTGGGRRRTPGTTGGGRRSNAGHAGCREARGASRGNTGRCPVKHRVFPQLALRASRQRQQRTGHPCPLPGHDGRKPTTVGSPRWAEAHDGRRPTTSGGRRRTPGTTGGDRRSNAGHAGCREARGASRGNTGRCPVKHRVFPQLALRASRQRQQRTGHPCPLPGYDGRRPTPHPGHDGRRTARARRAETVATLVFRVRAEDFCRCDRGGPASSCGFPETEISWRTTAPHTATHPKAP